MATNSFYCWLEYLVIAFTAASFLFLDRVMKIFGYEFRRFEEKTTTLETVDTWVVEWSSLHRNIIDTFDTESEFKTFTRKDQAELFRKELEDCARLLGDKGRMLKMYKQKNHSNV